MKKKIFSIVMALCLILAFMPTMAFAGESSLPQITMTVSPTNVEVGDTVTVTVSIPEISLSEGQDVGATVIKVLYTDDAFSDATGSVFSNNNKYNMFTVGIADGEAAVNAAGSDNSSTTYKPETLTLKFKADKAGTFNFTFSSSETYAKNGDDDILTSFDSKPASVTVAAKQVADQLTASDIAVADLVDKATSNAKGELVKDYAISAVADKAGEFNLTYSQLKKHTNGNNEEGYWVGVAVTAPTKTSTEKYFYKFAKNDGTATWTELPTSEVIDGKVSFYANAATATSVDICLAAAASVETIGQYKHAKVNLVEKVLHPATVIVAPLVDKTEGADAEAALYTDYSVTYDSGVATVTAKDLQEHQNGAGTSGKWVGVAVPEDGTSTTTLYYKYGADDEWQTAAMSGERYTAEGTNYVCFYVDAASVTSKEIYYAFDDSDVYYQLTLNTKLTKTGGTGGGSYVQKPTVVVDNSKGDVTTSSDGRTATITPKDGYVIDTVTVNGVDKGDVTKLTGLKTGDTIEVTFKAKDSTVFDLAAYLADLKLVARSEKTEKGNVKVTITSVKDGNDNDVELSELEKKGYTVEYKFYRSVKKASKYAKTLVKPLTDNTYTNTTGEKSTKYFYKARVIVKDAAGNVVGQTELKQCKYACRTWSK